MKDASSAAVLPALCVARVPRERVPRGDREWSSLTFRRRRFLRHQVQALSSYVSSAPIRLWESLADDKPRLQGTGNRAGAGCDCAQLDQMSLTSQLQND
ncbi:hypothetical protein J6590_061220 [Homalodisca vitripennis]|nr:hypothetical protein J6590_061220 [Homalodisca vitripennis]